MASDKKTTVTKKNIEVERQSLLDEEAKWTSQKTPFDHLPAHERPFNIQPFPEERDRLPFKMTDEDRLRRKKWIESQVLSPREPVRVPELETVLFNPIRRFYRYPMTKLFQYLTPVLGEQKAVWSRAIIPKVVLGYIGVCFAYYHLKYNHADWERQYGMHIARDSQAVYPGETPLPEKKKEDYYDLGFKSRKVLRGPEYAY